MNRDPDPTLQRDLFATSAAALRRKTRGHRQTTLSLFLAALLGTLTFLMVRPGTPPDLIASTAPITPSIAAPEPELAPAYDTLTTDQELLAALADQGPMLIIHSDGRKQLILTRP